MLKQSSFQPDWASPPGDTIRDLLSERGLSPTAFAEQVGFSQDEVVAILTGAAPITLDMARRLEGTLGATVAFWMSRDFQYWEDKSRVDNEWVAALPFSDMVQFGWVKPAGTRAERLEVCLQFFGVSSVNAWRQEYVTQQALAAFRTSKAFASEPGAVTAWLRQGEREADAIDCAAWNPARFRESLDSIRSLTKLKDPQRFLPILRNICAEGGVAVAVVRAPAGCRASGATRFLSPTKAMLLLSVRFLKDDQFWFTFFHEAGHLLLHGMKRLILEGTDSTPQGDENEADDFAALTLVPAEYVDRLMQLRANTFDVIRFAVDVGVSPGIIVGQLQHAGRIHQNQLNGLKRHYSWEG